MMRDITRIFLGQSREHLKPGAKLFMYSQFALGKNSKYALSETIRRDFANTFDARLARDDVAYVQAGYVTLKRDANARGKFQVSKTAYRYPNPKDDPMCLKPKAERPGGVFERIMPFNEGCGGNKTMDPRQMGRFEELCKRLPKN